MKGFMDLLTRVIHDYFTSADGQTFAVGRGLGIILFIAGLGGPSCIAGYVLLTQNPPLQEWVNFLTSLGVYLPSLTGAVTILIWGTNSTEPKPPQDPKG